MPQQPAEELFATNTAYDEENRLIGIFVDEGAAGGTANNGLQDGAEPTLLSLAYDALGRRIEIDGYQGDGTSGKRRFYFDGQNLIAEFDDVRAFMYNPGTSEAQNLYYFLKDLYTVAGLVDEKGHEVERYTYDTYGNAQIESVPTADLDYSTVVNASDRGIVSANLGSPCTNGTVYDVDGSGYINASDRSFVSAQIGLTVSDRDDSAFGNRFLFTGRWLDIIYDGTEKYDHKLQYNRARHYDPEMGRWLQRDPLEYVAGLMLYEYAYGAPAGLVDYDGRHPKPAGPQLPPPPPPGIFDTPGGVGPEPPPEGVADPNPTVPGENCVGRACSIPGSPFRLPGLGANCTDSDWQMAISFVPEGCVELLSPQPECDCCTHSREIIMYFLRHHYYSNNPRDNTARHNCDVHAVGKDCADEYWISKLGPKKNDPNWHLIRDPDAHLLFYLPKNEKKFGVPPGWYQRMQLEVVRKHFCCNPKEMGIRSGGGRILK